MLNSAVLELSLTGKLHFSSSTLTAVTVMFVKLFTYRKYKIGIPQLWTWKYFKNDVHILKMIGQIMSKIFDLNENTRKQNSDVNGVLDMNFILSTENLISLTIPIYQLLNCIMQPELQDSSFQGNRACNLHTTTLACWSLWLDKKNTWHCIYKKRTIFWISYN